MAQAPNTTKLIKTSSGARSKNCTEPMAGPPSQAENPATSHVTKMEAMNAHNIQRSSGRIAVAASRAKTNMAQAPNTTKLIKTSSGARSKNCAEPMAGQFRVIYDGDKVPSGWLASPGAFLAGLSHREHF